MHQPQVVSNNPFEWVQVQRALETRNRRHMEALWIFRESIRREGGREIVREEAETRRIEAHGEARHGDWEQYIKI